MDTSSKAGKRPKRATKPAAATKPAPRKYGPRADLGAPIDSFFAKQPPPLRSILVALRAIVEKAAPDAAASLKWGMPFYCIGDAMMCALGGHKSHVNLILSGPPEIFDDPDGLLVGDGRGSRHLRLTALEQLPRKAALSWVRAAASRARAKVTAKKAKKSRS